MYEDFRNDIITELSRNLNTETIKEVLVVIDKVAREYSISRTSKSLVPTNLNNELINNYLSCRILEGMSKSTADVKKCIISKFVRELNKSLTDITSNDIRAWIYLCMKTVGNRTVDSYRIHISALYEWLVDEGIVSQNPCKKIKPIRYTKNQRRSLSDLELEQLRMSCKSEKETALIEFLYSTGCRINEVSNVKLRDIDFINNSINVLGKGSKYRTVYISERCKLYLKKYIENRNVNSEYLFCRSHAPYDRMTESGLRYIFENIAKRAGIDKITPHTMRHTTATMLLKRDMPIEEISKLLGHSKLETTMIYAEIDDSEIKRHHEKYIA